MIGFVSNSYMNYAYQYQQMRQERQPEEKAALPGAVGADGLSPIAGEAASGKKKANGATEGECQTCKNRKYQDGSNDPGVSYKTPAKIDPKAARAAVMGHEMEHVSREQSKAKREGREVLSQSVRLKQAVCPECGKSYVSGGTTTTVTKGPQGKKFRAGLEDPSDVLGAHFDQVA